MFPGTGFCSCWYWGSTSFNTGVDCSPVCMVGMRMQRGMQSWQHQRPVCLLPWGKTVTLWLILRICSITGSRRPLQLPGWGDGDRAIYRFSVVKLCSSIVNVGDTAMNCKKCFLWKHVKMQWQKWNTVQTIKNYVSYLIMIYAKLASQLSAL